MSLLVTSERDRILFTTKSSVVNALAKLPIKLRKVLSSKQRLSNQATLQLHLVPTLSYLFHLLLSHSTMISVFTTTTKRPRPLSLPLILLNSHVPALSPPPLPLLHTIRPTRLPHRSKTNHSTLPSSIPPFNLYLLSSNQGTQILHPSPRAFHHPILSVLPDELDTLFSLSLSKALSHLLERSIFDLVLLA